MILTGKAKEDFFNWLDNQGVNGIDISNWEFEKFHLLSNVSQNALIIEWFDSVGIYIEVYRHNNRPTVQGFNSRIVRRINGYYECCIAVNTRNKAIQYAIKKANEIYNEKNSISQ